MNIEVDKDNNGEDSEGDIESDGEAEEETAETNNALNEKPRSKKLRRQCHVCKKTMLHTNFKNHMMLIHNSKETRDRDQSSILTMFSQMKKNNQIKQDESVKTSAKKELEEILQSGNQEPPVKERKRTFEELEQGENLKPEEKKFKSNELIEEKLDVTETKQEDEVNLKLILNELSDMKNLLLNNQPNSSKKEDGLRELQKSSRDDHYRHLMSQITNISEVTTMFPEFERSSEGKGFQFNCKTCTPNVDDFYENEKNVVGIIKVDPKK